jgi:sugar phosphate isomerase/epimerase
MKIGVFTVLFSQRPFEEALDYIKATGCEAVEIGCGGYPGTAHCTPAALLADSAAREQFKSAVTSRGLEISALSCHGNPLHPNAERAKTDDAVYRDTVKLARLQARTSAQPGSGRVLTRARARPRLQPIVEALR